MIDVIGQKHFQQSTSSHLKWADQSPCGETFAPELKSEWIVTQAGTGTNDMGSSISQPPTSGTVRFGEVCTIFKTAEGEYVISGNTYLLRDYFENDPEQWLRCLALKEG